MNILPGIAPWLSGLLAASLYASILALAVLAFQPLLGRQVPARWRFALWLLVLLRFVPLPLPASRMSVLNWLPRSAAPTMNQPPGIPHPPAAIVPDAAPARVLAPPAPAVAVSADATSSPPAVAAPLSPGRVPAAAPTPAPPATGTVFTTALLLNGLYLLGVLAVFVRLVVATFSLRRIVRRASLVRDPAILDLLDDARRTFGLRRPLPVRATDQLTSPALVGLWHPQLLLPRPLLTLLSAGELRLVFLHEAAHVRRRDVLANYALALLEIVHWFNPLVWFILPRIRAERELACDELVLRHTADAAPYGHTLLRLFEFARPARALAPAVGIIETRSFIARRIHMIADHRPRRGWLALPVAVAVLLAAGFLLTGPATRGQSQPGTTPQATTATDPAPYKGWVHMQTDGKPTEDWNTATGDMAGRISEDIRNQISGRTGPRISLQRGSVFEAYEYDPSTGTLLIGSMEPRIADDGRVAASRIPITWNALLDKLRTAIGADLVKVTPSNDRGMDRYDITVPDNPRANGVTGEFGGTPSTVWVDPKTHLLRELLVRGKTVTLTYGAPEITSAYDVGVPRDAKVVDNRATPEALAAYNRVMALAVKPIPDGILACLDEELKDGHTISNDLGLYARAGTHWVTRSFPVAENKAGALALPADWRDAGAEELFRRLATLPVASEHGGDGTITWYRDYDPVTGEISYTDHILTIIDGKSTASSVKHAGQKEYTGTSAQSLERNASYLQYFYPQEATSGLVGPDKHLELITASDRPGQVALRVRNKGLINGVPGEYISEEWFDPTHDDRAVMFIETYYQNQVITGLEVQEFSQYANFPAPDGRSFPTTMTITHFARSAEGNLAAAPNQTVRTFHFFPGKTLPEVAKKTPLP